MTTRQASIQDIAQLAILLAEYRVFYQKSFNPEAAKKFLQERMINQDSMIFIAFDDGKYAGFTQLYPSFSSVCMKKIWILNDLLVAPGHRRKGITLALINHVLGYSK